MIDELPALLSRVARFAVPGRDPSRRPCRFGSASATLSPVSGCCSLTGGACRSSTLVSERSSSCVSSFNDLGAPIGIGFF